VKGNHELGPRWKEFIIKEYEEESLIPEIQKERTEEDDILVVWTGGSTGAPKAVMISNLNFVAMASYEVGKFYEWTGHELGKDRIKSIANLPVSHVGGTIEMIGTNLIGGMQMITQKEWSPWPSLQVIKEEKLELLGGVPTMFSILTSLPDLEEYEPKKHLKAILMSGAKISLDLLKKVSETMCETIINGYGSTEAGSEVAFTRPGDSLDDIANGYVGIPVTGTDIKIVDKDGNRLPPNSEGEILVKGDITAKRYFKMPEETKRGFTDDGYCRTGDLGRLDENGRLWLTGRVKFIIRVGSYTVLPAEIENVANTAKNVLCSAAFGVPDEKYEQVVWLVVAPDPGATVDEEEIKSLLERELAKYKIPRKILIYETDASNLPFTSIGKVDRPRIQRELNIPQP